MMESLVVGVIEPDNLAVDIFFPHLLAPLGWSNAVSAGMPDTAGHRHIVLVAICPAQPWIQQMAILG